MGNGIRRASWFLCFILLATSAVAEPELKTLLRDDGSQINWSLDVPKWAEKLGLLISAQGSGCDAARISSNIQLARGKFPEFAAVTVEKYRVSQDDLAH